MFYAIDFGVANWSALYVRNVLLADAGTAALALAAYQCAALVSRLSGDFWIAKYDEIAVLRAGSAVGVAGRAVVVFAAAATDLRIGFVVPLLFAVGLLLLAPAFAPDRDREEQSEWAPDRD
ncbi:hypothetical protein [Rhodococcus sp. NCIMB 12038]|uniref:hypothetical protein n=1 Tax=Rhodococcus sp. NCIMB 12038 TaxID=933800 RepID=UPI00211AF135|nr:hypothetical protein [Rhodococcus sp. NCIMB 12038]